MHSVLFQPYTVYTCYHLRMRIVQVSLRATLLLIQYTVWYFSLTQCMLPFTHESCSGFIESYSDVNSIRSVLFQPYTVRVTMDTRELFSFCWRIVRTSTWWRSSVNRAETARRGKNKRPWCGPTNEVTYGSWLWTVFHLGSKKERKKKKKRNTDKYNAK